MNRVERVAWQCSVIEFFVSAVHYKVYECMINTNNNSHMFSALHVGVCDVLDNLMPITCTSGNMLNGLSHVHLKRCTYEKLKQPKMQSYAGVKFNCQWLNSQQHTTYEHKESQT